MNRYVWPQRVTEVLPWLSGFLLIAVGLALRPAAVTVQVHDRRNPSQVYWSGSFQAPAVEATGFFRAAMMDGYEFPPLPFPEQPQFRVTMRMNLVVSEEGVHGFELDSPWFGALDIGEQHVFGSGPFHPGTEGIGEIRLTPGVHAVRLTVQPSGRQGGLRLLWSSPTQKLRPVTPADLTTATRPFLHELGTVVSSPMLWIGGLLVGYLILRWIFGAQGPISWREKALAACLLGLLALAVRSSNAAYYPRAGGDEFHNAWAGWNLLHEGSPKTWSRGPVYPSKEPITWFSFRFTIVPASFGHAPLLPVLVGGTATLLGAQNMYQCTPARIRPLMVLIGSLGVVMLFLVCETLLDFQTAFLAGVLMAASPLVVFNSRLAKEENLVLLFWLVGLYLYLKFMRGRETPRLDYLCGAMLGLAALTKIHGNALGPAFAVVALADGPPNVKRAVRILGTSLGVGALYPLYGLLLDASTYLSEFSWLSQRYPLEDAADKFLILPRLILEHKIAAGTPMVDGWILLGWLSLPFLIRYKAISIPVVAYLLILMATINSGNLYGFYIIPIFPFLCIAAGVHIRRVLDGRSVLPVFLFVGLFFLPSAGRLTSMLPFGYRGLLVLSCLPLATSLLRHKGWRSSEVIERPMLYAMLLLGVLAFLQRCFTTL